MLLLDAAAVATTAPRGTAVDPPMDEASPPVAPLEGTIAVCSSADFISASSSIDSSFFLPPFLPRAGEAFGTADEEEDEEDAAAEP